MAESSPLLTAEQVSQYLQISPRTLEKMRADGSGPKFVRLGHKTVRYRLTDVQTWLQAREGRR